MIRRRFVTLLTAVAAAGLFGLLLVLGPRTDDRAAPRAAPIPDAPYVPLGRPDTAAGPRAGEEFGQVGGARRYAIQRRTRDGRLVEFVGDTYTPLPAGEALVGGPVARVALSGSRVVEIRADEARLVEQDRQPQYGTLRGNVRVTLYAGSPPRFGPDSPDAILRVFFDEPVEFDLLSGRIESPGPVHAASRRFDLRGQGLTLRYSDLANRIEHLELSRGDELRIGVDAGDAPAGTDEATDEAAASGPQPASPLPQQYHTRFERLTQVQRGDMTLTGDVLEAFFSLAADVLSDDALVDDSGQAASANGAGASAEHAPATAPGLGGRSMMAPREDDVVITWAGPLHLQPLAESLARVDDDGVLLRLTGRPMRIASSGREVATAGAASYRTTAGQIDLAGGAGAQVLIASPSLGMLECAQARFSPRQASATFHGPGRLRGLTGSADDAPAGRLRPAAGQTQGVDVTWTDRLEASFHSDPTSGPIRLTGLREAVFYGDAQALHPQGRLSGERLAVHLDEPQGRDGGRQTLRRITAAGDARLASIDPRPDAMIDMRAGQLTIELQPVPGRSGPVDQPVRLVAEDHAVLRRPGTRLFAERVTIDLADVPDEPAVSVKGPIRPASPRSADVMSTRGGDAAEDAASWLASALSPQLRATADLFAAPPVESEPAAAANVTHPPLRSVAPADRSARSAAAFARGVRHVEARGDITVELEDQGLVLLGDHLSADAAARQAELFGGGGQPARAVAAGSVLAGGHLLFDEAANRLHVVGPGSLALKELAMAQRAATPSAADAPDAAPAVIGDRLRITWHEAMHYDHAAAQATFTGDVRLAAAERDEQTELRCGHMALDLVEQADGSRAVHTATARADARGGEVVFLSQQHRADAESDGAASPRPVDFRLRLAGPVVTFDNVLEQVQVLGPGSLLVEDYRPMSASAARRASAASAEAPLVVLRGRGVTLLTWAGQMTVDARHNDLRAADDVVMDHMPQTPEGGSDAGVHLNCQRLAADLEATDGLSGWLSDHPPRPEIRGIYADRQVRVIAGGRTYLADRMAYTGGDQIVVLRGEIDGRGLTEIREGDGRGITARLVRWNLGANTYEIVQPGPMRAPVR